MKARMEFGVIPDTPKALSGNQAHKAPLHPLTLAQAGVQTSKTLMTRFAAAALFTTLAALPAHAAETSAISPTVFLAAIFAMACFVGYYVVWSVTPALHTPLMAVTNAISSVIVVGALVAAAAHGLSSEDWIAKSLGALAVALASVNIFGGFLVTQRMLAMYKKKGE